MAALVLAVLLILALPASATAAAGDLDVSFSLDGKATTNVTTGYDYAIGLVVQGTVWSLRAPPRDEGAASPSFGT